MAKSKTNTSVKSSNGKIDINVSISSNEGNGSVNESTSPIKSVESVSAVQEKVKSANSAVRESKRQVQKEVDKKGTNSVQEIEILKSIDKKLQDLNNNIIKIQSLKVSDTKNDNNINLKKEEKDIFDSKFIEGINRSFVSLIGDSNFKTRLKIAFSEIFDSSSLLKASDLNEFKSEISETINSSNYTVSNDEKAVDQTKYVSSSDETLKAINQEIRESNAAIESGSVKAVESIGDSIKSYVEKMEASTALNTSTSNEQINTINERLQNMADQVAQEQAKSILNTEEITKEAIKHDEVEDKKEKLSLDEESAKKTEEIESKEGEKPEQIDESITNDIISKIDEINDSLTENKESIDNLLEETRLEREIIEEGEKERKAVFDEKKKMMANKGGKISKIVGSIGSSISNIFLKKDNTFKRSGSKDLMKNQMTISGKNSLTPVKEFGANSKEFLMEQNMKKTGSLNANNEKNPTNELIKISTLLTGFLTFYKKTAKDAEDRELYKLRFGRDEKEKDNKIIINQRFNKGNGAKPKAEGGSKWGWIGAAFGLILAGLKFFGGKIGKMILSGLGKLTKLLGKGLWKLTTWIGKYALKGISWILGKVGGVLGKGLKAVWGRVSGVFGKVFGKIGGVLGKLGGKLIGGFKNVFGKVFGKASQLIGKIFGKLGGVFGKVFGKLGGVIGKLIGKIFGGKLGGVIGKFGRFRRQVR